LKRLLVAPRAAEVVETMHDHGLLALVLRRPPRVGFLAALAASEMALSQPGDPMTRLSALAVATEEDRAFLSERLRLSRAEAEAMTIVDVRLVGMTSLDDRARRATLYRLGAERWRRRAMLSLATSGATHAASGAAAASLRLIALPETWPPPEFPIRGADALSLGATPGPAVGAALEAVELWWIGEDFQPSREALLDRLRTALS
jgi:tRNA nucleotidyltransferase/poly(A) polymerase